MDLKIEEIRAKTGMNQTEFAKAIGSSFRTYLGRLSGSQPNWQLSEIIKAAEFNDGEVVVHTSDGDYFIKVEKR